ncbi:MAG: thiamine phosphate synthase [Phycisphaerales bacterium]
MDGLLRTLDANANRAREALRTLEDTARFTLGHADLAGALKGARHDLRATLDAAGLDALRLMAMRDTPGDVGTALSTPAEGARMDARGIAVAAGKRAGEALRVIEETLKVVVVVRETKKPGPAPRPPWEAVKELRYRVYECERRLILALGAGRATQWGLCVLISESLCRLPWLDVARAAIAGGADCLQLREKALDGGELLRRAEALVRLAQDGGRDVRPTKAGPACARPACARPAVIINDRADVALAAGADGVHLGQHDVPVAAVRGLAGERLLVGVSTHDMVEARRAASDGADYCGVGAMFATATKPREVSGPVYLQAYLRDEQTGRVPHLAIGGITAENVPSLWTAGCRGVAVSGAVCGAPDPEAACRAIVACMAPAAHAS